MEQEILQLGPGVLKGNKLERTGPKRYKIGGNPGLGRGVLINMLINMLIYVDL